MENNETSKESSFYMVDTPSEKRHTGWPLDSISLNKDTLTYFVDKGNNKYNMSEENVVFSEYRKRFVRFLTKALGIT